MNKFLKLIILLFVGNATLGQEVVFDYAELSNINVKDLDVKVSPVEYGGFTNIKIRNINTFLFDVKIEGKNMSLNTPMPSELQRLFNIDEEDLISTPENAQEGLNNTDEAIELMTEIAKSNETPEVLANKTKVLIKKCDEYYNMIKDVINGISNVKKVRKDLISLAKSNLPFAKIQSEFNSIKIPDESSLSKQYVMFELLYFNVERLYDGLAAENSKARDKELENLINKYNAAVYTQKMASNKAREQVKSKNQKSNIDEDEKLRLDMLHLNFQHDSSNVVNNFKKIEEKIAEATEKIEEGYHLLESETYLSYINDVSNLKRELKEEENFTVLSPLIQMDADYAVFKISITPGAGAGTGPKLRAMSWETHIPAKGGWKVDFSMGPIISFGTESNDENVYLEDVIPDSLSNLGVNLNKNAMKPSLGALMHFYPRTGKTSALGGLFGIGAGFQTISDIDLRVFGGLSMVLGKYEKVMLNAGISYLRVNRLKEPQYELGRNYLTSDLTVNEITEKVFRPSLFFGISYNLTNRIER
ncbi:hypothetical protein [Jiulongibacter sediminis]|uniref:Outer membrane protein beta-barrel domain-containing protein n=1 Tax=Jiulongibacter sediminis TaxID=1605367 RepID=A0A0P7BKU6_9BACT|nr:hypothetical protein [Jiulongibacter sediminis]KPM47886.1 hypothetical protein AFM12_11660 [Jiulongibacter sediminis]TBX24069.1 hypothetical protein TK44_11670 [Jiulongibacter sediminis]